MENSKGARVTKYFETHESNNLVPRDDP